MLCAVAGWTRGAVPGVTCGLAHCPVPLSAGQAFPDEGGGAGGGGLGGGGLLRDGQARGREGRGRRWPVPGLWRPPPFPPRS